MSPIGLQTDSMGEICLNQTEVQKGHAGDASLGLSGVISHVLLPAVCLFGIVGNLLNLTVLTRRKLQKSLRTLERSANLCLIFLAVSDLMICLSAFLTMFLPRDHLYADRGLLLYYALYSAAVINTFIMESTLLTVTMSLERYLAICFPLRKDMYLTTGRLKLVIVLTFLFSASFNIPVLFRYQVCPICVGSQDSAWSHSSKIFSNNITAAPHFGLPGLLGGGAAAAFLSQAPSALNIPQFNESILPSSGYLSSSRSWSPVSPFLASSDSPLVFSAGLTTSWSLPGEDTNSSAAASCAHNLQYTTVIVLLAGNQAYDNAYRLIWAFVGNFIPLLLLFYFNVCLCRKIYRSYRLRKQLGRQGDARSSSQHLTMTLVAVVLLFFLLVAPSELTLQLARLSSYRKDSPQYQNIEAVMNLMQSLNFSVNFILYCIINPYFRKTFAMLCGCSRFYNVSGHWKTEFQTSLL